jgi:hypothetical protein
VVLIIRVIGTIIGSIVALIGTIVMVAICALVIVLTIACSPFMAVSVLFGKRASDYSGLIEKPLRWCVDKVSEWWKSLFSGLYR